MTRWRRNFRRFRNIPDLGNVTIVHKDKITGHDVKKILERTNTDVIVHATRCIKKPSQATLNYINSKSVLIISMDTESRNKMKILRSAISYVHEMLYQNAKRKHGYMVEGNEHLFCFKGQDGKINNIDIIEYVTDGMADVAPQEFSIFIDKKDFLLLGVMKGVVEGIYHDIKNGVKYHDGEIHTINDRMVKFVKRTDLSGKETLRLVLAHDGKFPENIYDKYGYMLGSWEESMSVVSTIPGIDILRDALGVDAVAKEIP